MEFILNSDCLEGLLGTDNDTADLILCDPPYFDYRSGHRKDKDSKLSKGLLQQSREDQIRVVQECMRVLKQDRAGFFFTNWEQSWWMLQALGTLARNMIIWDKGNWTAGDLHGSFGNRYEVIILAAKGKWLYTGKREADIWGNLYDNEYDLNRMGTDRIHTTEKPVDLYKKIINNSTMPGAFIIDPYGGSGSSVEAAMELKRDILVYELDTEYYTGILNRIERYKANAIQR